MSFGGGGTKIESEPEVPVPNSNPDSLAPSIEVHRRRQRIQASHEETAGRYGNKVSGSGPKASTQKRVLGGY